MAKNTRKKVNPNDSVPLAELLQYGLGGTCGLPKWAIAKCSKLGVFDVADLYRLIYLRPSTPGVGSVFVTAAQKMLSGLGLNDRIGLANPFKAVENEARAQAFREYNDMLPERLERHGAQMKEGFEASRSMLEELHQLRVDQIVAGFRGRVKILKEALKDATRQEMSFTADTVSPESAGKWLALQVAGKVPEGFAIKADLIYVTHSGLPFMAAMTLGLSSASVANVLVAHSQRSDAMIEVQGRFYIDYPTKRVEVAESTIQARFLDQGLGRLARIEGIITIQGMSDAEIKKLFVPDGTIVLDDDGFHGQIKT